MRTTLPRAFSPHIYVKSNVRSWSELCPRLQDVLRAARAVLVERQQRGRIDLRDEPQRLRHLVCHAHRHKWKTIIIVLCSSKSETFADTRFDEKRRTGKLPTEPASP